MNKGSIYAISAYVLWGLLPIYWKLLKSVPSIEIISHRIVWCLIFFLIIIAFQNGWKDLVQKIKVYSFWKLLIPAFLIGANWGVYIWAVNADYVIEASLGYFIAPLVNVFLGVILLKEKLRNLQWIYN